MWMACSHDVLEWIEDAPANREKDRLEMSVREGVTRRDSQIENSLSREGVLSECGGKRPRIAH